MKRSDALPSASRNLQVEVGVTEFSWIPAYTPYSARFFGGNRDSALERDGRACRGVVALILDTDLRQREQPSVVGEALIR